jgi:hypothetical protein
MSPVLSTNPAAPSLRVCIAAASEAIPSLWNADTKICAALVLCCTGIASLAQSSQATTTRNDGLAVLHFIGGI